jgi:hypothetical protein
VLLISHSWLMEWRMARMNNAELLFAFAGLVVVFVGVFGYLIERRKGGAPAARRFLAWCAFAIPFAACALVGSVYPKLHWLYYLAGAMAVVGTLVQWRGARGGGRQP